MGCCMKIILEILYNFGMLASVSILSGFIPERKGRHMSYGVLQGVLFGLASVLGMMKPLVLAEGLIFDGRSVMLSLCGLFFGPLAGGLASVMAGFYRLYQGGPGATMGLLVIGSSTLIGIGFYYLRGFWYKEISLKVLIHMGLLVHGVMLLCMFALPKAAIFKTLTTMGLPVIIVYPLATLAIGKILGEANTRMKLAETLLQSETKLKEANADLEASLEEILAQEEEIHAQYNRLIESEDRFRKIFELAPIGINLADNQTGRFLQVNQKFADILGRPAEELLNMDWISLTHEADVQDNMKISSNLLDGQLSVFELNKRYIKPKGDTVWANIKVIDFGHDAFGTPRQLCFVEDITDKKAASDAIAASEFTFRTLFEGSADAIMLLKETEIYDCNQASLKMFKLESKEDLLGKKPWELSPKYQPDGLSSEIGARDNLRKCLDSGSVRFEWWHLAQSGEQIPVEIVLTRILLNGQTLIHAMSRDISERKAIEHRLHEMSYHDQLTGLYNRRFFEETLSRMDQEENLPYSILMADVNGLKLVNDSFGHQKGDQLLVEVARIITAGCRESDLVSRIGGDEFAILLPQTTAEEAKQLVERIDQLAARQKIGSLVVSIAFGWETKLHMQDSILDVLKKAEDQMYKRKLFESPSIRSKTIDTIIQTLYEKNRREEQHSHRVSEICESIGKALWLLDPEIRELKSLGLLHDIGKIAIDEYLLNKPGKLLPDERSEMERHPEIGYRILSTVNEMADMAEAVLCHHERWDGFGYPRGLKGDEIPLKSRIISIADAYDAMTSDRSYRKALSHEAAMKEILQNSGTQFDPILVSIFAETVQESLA